MKAKTLLVATFMMLVPAFACGQQNVTAPDRATVESHGDSVIVIRKGKGDLRIRLYEKQADGQDEEEKEIFEGVYLEKVDADKRSFLDALPLIPKKRGRNQYKPHISGVFIGYSRMADSFMGFGASAQAHQNLFKSWEFGFNILCTYFEFRKNPHWGVNTGLSWGYRSFSFDGDYALLKGDGNSYFQSGKALTAGPDGTETSSGNPYYSGSRLRHFFFRIPVQLEWQQRMKTRKLLFFNIGPEFEIRHGVKSFTHINDGKKQTMGKGMYVQPVGVNLLVQGGYGDVGLYLRYSFNRMFQKNKGPEVSPYSFGISFYL